MFAPTVIILFYVIILRNTVVNQVCIETRMSWRDVPETYLYTYLEAYEKTNCLFWCSDTRVASAVGTRMVRKQIPEQVNVCCDGYVLEESYTGNSVHCKPSCSELCINGYCKSPDVCACNPGYLPDILEPHKCIPLCLKGCEHGTCEAPNSCKCDQGYESIDGVCTPICFEPCENGACVAPDTCQCLSGYKKTEYGICEPYCSSYTADGECINTITCEPGWARVIKGPLEICEPVCATPCFNGTCVAPETCECLDGYEKSLFETCVPYCSSGCPNGFCIGPETCVCEPGWFKKESSGICIAHCDHACGNGTCIAPDICECYPGYIFDESRIDGPDGTPLCVPICKNCREPCDSLEVCICDWPQEPIRVSADGTPCEPDMNNNECGRIMCSLNTTTLLNYAETEPVEVASVLTFSTTEAMEPETTDDNGNQYSKIKIDQASWFHSKWFYGIGSVFLTSIVIIMVAAILKRRTRTFERNIFGSKVDDVSAVVHYKQTHTA